MNVFRYRIGVALVFTIAVTADLSGAAQAGLSIVVIEGENAVNVIQQKSATSPLVEVRDINGQPVGGATVRFAVEGGRATFNGARAVTVTTNAAGRATVTGMTPTSSGTFQISASATFQGQSAALTIGQTNVMTAAQAASVASTSGAGGVGSGVAATGAAAGGAAAGGAAAVGGTAAGGAAAGGAATGGAAAVGGAASGGAAAAGGGLSAMTIGIVGGAVAGGTLATKQVLLGGGGPAIYEGDFRIDVVSSKRDVRGNGTVFSSCTTTTSFTGEVRGEIDEHEDGTLTGTISANGYYQDLSTTCPPSAPGPLNEKISFGRGDVTGTAAGFQVNGGYQSDTTSQGLAFSGTLNDGVITGTFTIGPSLYKSIPNANGGFGDSSFPATSTQVRLTK